MSREQFEDVSEPSQDELYAISGSGFGFPSSKYEDLELGASGTTYTAPANGWFYLSKTTSSTNQYIHFGNETKDYTLNQFLPTSGNNCRLIFPVQKGDIVKTSYTAGGTTNAFRFIYAEGE